jgi:hypothetical protein
VLYKKDDEFKDFLMNWGHSTKNVQFHRVTEAITELKRLI